MHGDTPRSLEDWTRLLSISHQFGIEKIRNRAITALEDMGLGPVERIVLAVNHDIPAWLKPAYVDLCQRKEPLREDEARKLGWSTTVKLACARERLREDDQKSQSKILSGDPYDFDHRSVRAASSTSEDGTTSAESIIREIFYPATMVMTPDLPPTPLLDPEFEQAVVAVTKGGKKKKGKW